MTDTAHTLSSTENLVLMDWVSRQRDFALEQLAKGEWVACAVCLQMHTTAWDWGLCQTEQ